MPCLRKREHKFATFARVSELPFTGKSLCAEEIRWLKEKRGLWIRSSLAWSKKKNKHTKNISLLTSALIKSWPGVWVASPEPTGTAPHRSYQWSGRQTKSSSKHHWAFRDCWISMRSFIHRGVLRKNHCLPKEVLQDGDAERIKEEGRIKRDGVHVFILLHQTAESITTRVWTCTAIYKELRWSRSL